MKFDPTKNEILPLINVDTGCGYHRLLLPLKQMGIDLNYFEDKIINDVIKNTKILLFNRIPTCSIEQCIKMREDIGLKIVVDIDDYWFLNSNHLLSSVWRKNHMSNLITTSMKIADAVICTTSVLADQIRPLNKNVHIIPNGLPFDEGQFNSEKYNFDEGTRFIYAGGNSHFWDIQTLRIPFSKVNDNKSLSNAYFNLAGYDGGDKNTKQVWLTIENSFNLRGKLRNYTRYDNLPLSNYMDHYNNADVALIPLEYNNFNRYKSNLKILEAGCKNIAAICSDVEPYSNEPIKDHICYAKNASQWYEWIKYFTQNPNAAIDKGLSLGEYVREHYNLTKINEHRKQLFEHLMS